MGNRV